MSLIVIFFVFFFNDTATTEIYTLSLHDALPIYQSDLVARLVLENVLVFGDGLGDFALVQQLLCGFDVFALDRKSTRLNSSHEWISYAVFCLKKKKNKKIIRILCIISYDQFSTAL